MTVRLLLFHVRYVTRIGEHRGQSSQGVVFILSPVSAHTQKMTSKGTVLKNKVLEIQNMWQ